MGTEQWPPVARFRWPSGAWFAYRITGSTPADVWTPWPDDEPWPQDAVDRYVSGGGNLVPAQLLKVKARPCMLHTVPLAECGCPAMYEVLAAERLGKAQRKLEEIGRAAETAKPDPTPAESAAPAVASEHASPTPGDPPGMIWAFRCLDCRREMLNPPMPEAGDACPECGNHGVFVWRSDMPEPPHENYANLIAFDGRACVPDRSACYVCGGPIGVPGGAMARLRNGFMRAHLACVQEKRDRARSSDAQPFVRVGDPSGYCHACKTPFKAGELTLFGGRVHALAKACQAGPEAPAVAPVGQEVKRTLKEPCVVCEKPMEKGQTVCKHLDGKAHVTCVTLPRDRGESPL